MAEETDVVEAEGSFYVDRDKEEGAFSDDAPDLFDVDEEVEPQGEPEAEAVVEEAAAPAPEELSPSEKARREIQSKYDSLVARMGDLEERAKAAEELKPFADLFDSDPRFQQHLAAFFDGSQQGGQADVNGVVAPSGSATTAASTPFPEMPEYPVKPANYNKYDATNEATSESAKWEAAALEYPAKLAQWQAAMLEHQKAEAVRVQHEQRAAAERAQAQQAIQRSWLTYFAEKEGMDESTAQAALRWAGNLRPDSAEYRQIIAKAYLARTNAASNPTEARARQLREEAAQRTAPVAAASVASASKAEKPEETAFQVVTRKHSLVD